MNDGTLGGDAKTVLDDLRVEQLVEELRSIGLVQNFSKCELFITKSVSESRRAEIISKFNLLTPTINILAENIYILDDSISAFINGQIVKFTEKSNSLSQNELHMAFFVIRFYLCVPKLIYVIRCSHLWKFEFEKTRLKKSTSDS